MLLICYPRCSTCKKAQKWLDEKGIVYTYRDIKEENPSFDELKTWVEKSGLDIKRFFNTSGLLYKSMSLKDKLPAMSTEEKLILLSSDGMLVKRPIVVTDSAVLVGFREQEWAENLL
nr:arsenate reductase family protein [uncultured Ruminococcus sp.]